MSQDRTGPIVHVREGSDHDMELLFKVANQTNPNIRPMKDRNLPPSFFNPKPQSHMGVRDGHNVYQAGVNSQVNHTRAHSSPAIIQANLSTAPPPPPTSHHHTRQHSYDLLDEPPLPQGWDMAKTPQGQRYYLK